MREMEMYRFFTKDGRCYTTQANNPVEAREHVELVWRVNLKGSTVRIYWKMHLVEEMKVR